MKAVKEGGFMAQRRGGAGGGSPEHLRPSGSFLIIGIPL